MARAAATWTQTEKDFLTKSYSSFGSKKCAAALERPEGAVRTMANRLGLKLAAKNATHRKLGHSQKAEIVALYRSDPTISAQAIIDQLKLPVKVDCVYKALAQAGVKRGTTGQRNRRWTDAEELVIVADYVGGMSQPEIAAAHSTRPGVISGILKRRGVKTRHQEREISDVEWTEIIRRYQAGDVIVEGIMCRYTPDFVLTSADGDETLVEVKGRWFTRSRLKVESFRLLYPHAHLEVWDASVLTDLGILRSITERNNERRRKASATPNSSLISSSTQES